VLFGKIIKDSMTEIFQLVPEAESHRTVFASKREREVVNLLILDLGKANIFDELRPIEIS
jgi:hypothetical protein